MRTSILAALTAPLALTACGGGGSDTASAPTPTPTATASAPRCAVSLRTARTVARFLGSSDQRHGAGSILVVRTYGITDAVVTGNSTSATQNMVILRNRGKERLEVRGRAGRARVHASAAPGCGAVATLRNRGRWHYAIFEGGKVINRISPQQD